MYVDILGFLFNILSNFSYLIKYIFITVAEHMIIGSILTFVTFLK